MPALDLAAIEVLTRTGYPAPYDAPVAGRSYQFLAAAGGLTQFGVTRTRLAPGAWSSQRHWHSTEDEFVVVLEGEVTLVTDTGRRRLGPGDCAAFPAGLADGHHFINEGGADALFIAVGTDRADDVCTYSDIDMTGRPEPEGYAYRRRDGAPYPAKASTDS